MRRLTIELNLEEMAKLDGLGHESSNSKELLQKIKSFEILQFLKDGPEEFAMICKVQFQDEATKIEDLMDEEIIELQLLDSEKGGARTYFIKSKPAANPEMRFNHLTSGGYLSVPFEIKDGRARLTYLGNGKQIKAFIEGVEKTGVKYRVSSITDAKFSQNSPLSRLTEKQRRVLVTAYRFGYYDEPRRISSLELARKMKVGSSTLINHRRRAERHLLAELVGD